ncbi:hypothetical protein [Rhizobium tumorigenes]|uniref:hypothetical protein n=1 Tax=Rhizobium tumorigenes TaxID=2041385 RepID=UPI00241DAB1D|nr:hypothetical protein [Rhizobium tumorigenes]WFS00351.1 hypothetical protein PR016_14610 [Rhizobium tumorigenes]
MHKLLMSFAALVVFANSVAAYEIGTSQRQSLRLAKQPTGIQDSDFILPLDPTDSKGSSLVRQQKLQHETICFYRKASPVAIAALDTSPLRRLI